MAEGIQLTEAQEKEALNLKRTRFLEGIEKLQEETGLTIVALLKTSLTKIEAVLQIVPITPDNKAE